MQPVPIQSSNVQAVHYAQTTQVLTVWFHSGGVYEYQRVAESLYQGFLAAQPHPWSVFGQAIKAHGVRRLA
jgi:hypothetical protein